MLEENSVLLSLLWLFPGSHTGLELIANYGEITELLEDNISWQDVLTNHNAEKNILLSYSKKVCDIFTKNTKKPWSCVWYMCGIIVLYSFFVRMRNSENWSQNISVRKVLAKKPRAGWAGVAELPLHWMCCCSGCTMHSLNWFLLSFAIRSFGHLVAVIPQGG